jgi:hypothetical protein
MQCLGSKGLPNVTQTIDRKALDRLSTNKKRSKNRLSRSAKVSTYKTQQLVECFARDLPIADAARLTKMSERTVRDRYAELREKLLSWCIRQPDWFNGFGHLLLDADGTINAVMLGVLTWYGQSATFKTRMAMRYPKWRAAHDAALPHVIEHALRRFCAFTPPEITADFRQMVLRVFAQAYMESTVRTYTHQRALPLALDGRAYWRAIHRRINAQTGPLVRNRQANGERFYRDLRLLLLRDPL